MEKMIVIGTEVTRESGSHGAALPVVGHPLRPRLGSVDARTTIGGSVGTAITPNPAPALDVTSARTS